MNIAEMCLVFIPAVYPSMLSYPTSSTFASDLKVIAQNLHLTPLFLAGSLIVWCAAALRVSCYRHLGRHFTFELALRKDHQLVTTGPYAIVRHPSYTASLMFISGSTLLVLVDKGSLCVQLGLRVPRLARVLGTGIIVLTGIALSQFIDRTLVEDRVLKQEFGEEWVRWSQQTRYRLIPGIF